MSNLNLQSSQRLIETLSKINHQISHALLNSIMSRERQRISYLDFGNSNDNISYIINNKVDEIVNSNYVNWKELVWTDKRTNLKIGKFIKMLYGDVFPINQSKDQPSPKVQNDIESFVNKFKFERDKNINFDRFEIVSGDMIRHWYSHENYTRYANSETALGKSCMRYVESGKFLKMYTENPHIFSMLILKDEQGKLKGRALIWNLSKPEGRMLMDRIYCVNDHDIESFKNYAKEQGWMYRYQQCFGWFNKIVDPTVDRIIDQKDILLEAELKYFPEVHYNYYPYLDTLSIYNKNTHILSNDGKLRTKSGHLLLTDYQGRYHSEVDERPRVYSEVYQEDILEEDSVYVEIDDSYIYRHDEVYVHNSGGKKAYKNSSKIVRSKLPNKDPKYFLKESAVWSEYLNTFIHNESIREAYLDDQKTKSVLIHYRMIGKNFVRRDGGIFFNDNVSKTTDKQKQDIFNSLEKMTKREMMSRFGSTNVYDIYKNIIKDNISHSSRNEIVDNDEVSGEEDDNSRSFRGDSFSSRLIQGSLGSLSNYDGYGSITARPVRRTSTTPIRDVYSRYGEVNPPTPLVGPDFFDLDFTTTPVGYTTESSDTLSNPTTTSR